MLLFVFLCGTAGIFGLFSLLKEENYESVFSRNVDKLDLINLVIPKSDKIHWEKKNEIIYKGKYYDVFSKSEDDKNFYLLCHTDSKDDQLTETFHKVSEENSNKKSAERTIVKVNFQNYILQSCDWNINQSSAEKISIQNFTPVIFGFTFFFSPPPDFLVC